MPKNVPHPGEPKRASTAQRATPRNDAPQPAEPDAAGKPVNGFSGLGGLRAALKTQAQQRERERAEAAAARVESAADSELFRREIGAVAPLAAPPRAPKRRAPPVPLPLQTQLDEQAVLHEAISDDFDPETLLDTDDSLYYHRPGVSSEVVRKLRRGTWIVQAQLDLHGLRRDEAREALQAFIREAGKRGLRCVRVIHGKGLGSVGKEPVLKGKVRAWLVQKEEVIAFCQARPHDGGAGAVLVLLQPQSPGAHRGPAPLR
ncbi:Smr/MutS family protein [Paraburkholderia caballeronis]|uniref:Smr/MutS family protein n=1 Tax=Paraburkholderia caballeronis TaxID=416943 RepID=UPI0010654B7B|nr:Smr/MutS family protein [Paraburkholderia caballeronis]TDV06957.1 DNA-nicking Smr family endonuclease [Paraburkholderia caballeronis]TDV10936.1 DNA-nicking Smr family endonuclease [Paraburkholderia caballeronis]TDV22374.1 DNA-nicking Smr family endonuclease [Paraburkholderia caballeronis]